MPKYMGLTGLHYEPISNPLKNPLSIALCGCTPRPPKLNHHGVRPTSGQQEQLVRHRSHSDDAPAWLCKYDNFLATISSSDANSSPSKSFSSPSSFLSPNLTNSRCLFTINTGTLTSADWWRHPRGRQRRRDRGLAAKDGASIVLGESGEYAKAIQWDGGGVLVAAKVEIVEPRRGSGGGRDLAVEVVAAMLVMVVTSVGGIAGEKDDVLAEVVVGDASGLRMVENGGAIIFTSVVGFDGILKDLSKRD
ncbi:hypothetical protein NL676_004248 [Syzygium grande]|nr:hypothetical protein NL676_004248 [Syzygium grande]